MIHEMSTVVASYAKPLPLPLRRVSASVPVVIFRPSEAWDSSQIL